MQTVNLRDSNYQPCAQALAVFPEHIARARACFPVRLDDYNVLFLAIPEEDWTKVEMHIRYCQISTDLGITSNLHLQFVVAPAEDILWAIGTFYKNVPPAQKPADTLTTLRAGHGDDPLLNPDDEKGELPKGGAKVPCVLHLHFKSIEQAERFMAAKASDTAEGLAPEKIVFE